MLTFFYIHESQSIRLMHIFEIWEETGATGGNPDRPEELHADRNPNCVGNEKLDRLGNGVTD